MVPLSCGTGKGCQLDPPPLPMERTKRNRHQPMKRMIRNVLGEIFFLLSRFTSPYHTIRVHFAGNTTGYSPSRTWTESPHGGGWYSFQPAGSTPDYHPSARPPDIFSPPDLQFLWSPGGFNYPPQATGSRCSGPSGQVPRPRPWPGPCGPAEIPA